MTSPVEIVDRDAFAPFGVVFPVLDGHRAHVRGAVIELARARLGEDLEVVGGARQPTGRPDGIEVHPESDQLTVSLDSSWVVRVLPPNQSPDSPTAAVRRFVVPARLPLAIRAGIWHAPVEVLGPTEIVTVFRAGTTASATEWRPISPPETESTSR
jgi:ureidoglycolate hydrolase